MAYDIPAVYIILTIVIGLSVLGLAKKIRYGMSCCGEHERPPKKVRVHDTDRSHYPFTYELSVDGMYCSNCARRIENAFNLNDGLWARTDTGLKKVELLSKRKISEDECRMIVSEAGYTLLALREV